MVGASEASARRCSAVLRLGVAKLSAGGVSVPSFCCRRFFGVACVGSAECEKSGIPLYVVVWLAMKWWKS